MKTQTPRNFSQEADKLISRLAKEIQESESSLKSLSKNLTHSENQIHTEFADVVIEEFLSRSERKQNSKTNQNLKSKTTHQTKKNENLFNQKFENLSLKNSKKNVFKKISEKESSNVSNFETNISGVSSKESFRTGNKRRNQMSLQSTAEKTHVTNNKISASKISALTESILNNEERLKELETKHKQLSLSAKSVIDYKRVQKSNFCLRFFKISNCI